jgi:magnesium chelatase family protein
VVLHRAQGAARYPARFQLVMAANPCPCGRFNARGQECTCPPTQRRRYMGRLSGPLLDRVDLRVEVLPVQRGMDQPGESSAVVAQRVSAARARASARLAAQGWDVNAQASGRWLREHTPKPALALVLRALDRGAVTARGADRSLRVAWTLADLDGVDQPTREHVSGATALRAHAAT